MARLGRSLGLALRCCNSYRFRRLVPRSAQTDDNDAATSNRDERVMDLPIVCELGPGTLRARREEFLVGLAARATKQEKTAAIDAERQCCRWLRFAMTMEPDDGPITLTLSGPHGSRVFLSALFASH